MPDFDTQKPQEPEEPKRPRVPLLTHRFRNLLKTGLNYRRAIQLTLLTIGVLFVPIFVLIHALVNAGFLTGNEGFPTGNEGFPTGLHGKVPSYDYYRTTDDRECSYHPEYENYCYYVSTEAHSKRALALIAEDIIRKQHLSKSPNRMMSFTFHIDGLALEDGVDAFAFTDKAAAKKITKEYGMERGQNYSVIDGIYVKVQK